MRALVNGVEGGSLSLFRGEDAAWKIMVLADDGSIVNVTGDTVTLEFYSRADRRDAATATVTLTLTTPTSGFMTGTITDTASALLTAGQLYYAFVKRDAGGAGAFSYGAKPTTVMSV